MIKNILIEQAFCDTCGKKASGYQRCISCGKEFCSSCVQSVAVEYRHSVYCSGSGDGIYCIKCDKEAIASGDKLHKAYRAIKSLRNQLSGFYVDFENRAKKAEEDLKGLQLRGSV